jgi:Outer membrane protein beta-barrel domain
MNKLTTSLLAVALLATGAANAQTTNSSYSNGSTTTTTTGPATTPTTYPSTTTTYSSGNDNTSDNDSKGYKAFAFGVYAGVNTTSLRGESIPNGQDKSGRIGYQIGAYGRGGGRLFGQLGVEYFASSSNFFRPGDGQSLSSISGQIDTKYIQIPVYVGYKLVESDRGISAIRLQVGAEYANQISNSNTVNINSSEIKSGSFNALGQLGFDFGPVFIDLTYHHGLSNTINGFNNSQRRILGANFGFKF